jgi:hypothetical protein
MAGRRTAGKTSYIAAESYARSWRSMTFWRRAGLFSVPVVIALYLSGIGSGHLWLVTVAIAGGVGLAVLDEVPHPSRWLPGIRHWWRNP